MASVKNRKKKDEKDIAKINDKLKRFLFVNKFFLICDLSKMYINVKNNRFEINGLGNLRLQKFPENDPISTTPKLLTKHKQSGST